MIGFVDWGIRIFTEYFVNNISSIVASILPLIVAYYLWDWYEQPSLSIQKCDWDHWVDDRRYYLTVKNSGRKAAQKCQAELFMVILSEDSREGAIGDKERKRLHIPLGWLPIRQNTTLKPDPEDLVETQTIPGKSTERVYFGFASTETMRYSLPRTMKTPPPNEHATPEGLKLSVRGESDYKDLIDRFQNKNVFFPAHHMDLTMVLSGGMISSINWRSEDLVKAEVRIIAENTSETEASINMFEPPERSTRLPKFYLDSFKGHFRAYISWNRTYHRMKKGVRLRWRKLTS